MRRIITPRLHRLEGNLPTQLDVSLSELGSNQAEISGSWACRRVAEKREIREVEDFEAELGFDSIAHRNVLEQRGIPILETWSSDNVQPRVTESAIPGETKGRSIEPLQAQTAFGHT